MELKILKTLSIDIFGRDSIDDDNAKTLAKATYSCGDMLTTVEGHSIIF